MKQVGEIIAFQDEDGHVYTGIVSSVQEQGTSQVYNIDILADGVYRRLELSES
jgi:hypothetical protein